MVINDDLLVELEKKALQTPRKRQSLMLHKDYSSNAQKLLNFLCPNTEVPIHRHPNKNETYIIIKGHIEVVFVDNKGVEQKSITLNPNCGYYGIDIPAGQWHTVRVKAPTLMFECSDGPYLPQRSTEFL